MEDAITLQQELAELKKQYQTVVDALYPNFIFVFDYDFHFVDVITPAKVRLFHSKEELIGKDGRSFYSPAISDLLIENIRFSIDNNQWREIEYHLDVGDTRHYYQARIVPIEGKKVMCMIQDIGNRVRRMEELMMQRKRIDDANRQKNAFLANVSHEIRTPLNAIISFSEFLMTEEAPETRQSYMDIIRNSNGMVLQIINDVLDLSRLESGMSEFFFEDINVVALMKETIEIYQPEMKPQVSLNIEIPDVNIHVPTDANRVKQVLFNFLSNAMKYTAQGSITLKLEKGDDFLKFSVIDTGCGIPEHQLDVIFNRYEKIGRQMKGTGLGLAICKSIVEQLGGNIGVSSKENQGCTFWFTIPYRPDLVDNSKIENINDSIVENSRKKILIADICNDSLDFVKNTLSEQFDVVVLNESEKIFCSFILDNPNLIIVSIEIVNKSDIITKIRSISADIPIIAIASSDYYHDQRWAIECGCSDVISRPFSAGKITEAVMAFMG